MRGTTTALTYDALSTQYTLIWRTTAAMKGCRHLVLRFRDGSQLVATFSLR
ncbi:MAG: PxKF domain-containing protein [Actinobacteria bacterium]|nr:PxKF domain-containing protein [Actinomycetota bacterium]